MQQLLS
jgi:hypothetical protein